MRMDLPNQVRWIIKQLNAAGFEAYAVGGCVRDMLLNKEPMDWDLTTNAKPEQVKRVFNKTVDTGIEHGTVTVIKNGKGYEVTTYRVDGEYEDGRHPKEVTFTTELKDDLCRRDFTINAMAYNDEKGFVDCFGGRQDLADRIIRCVGDPYERFTEDALRILRAMRFSSQLEFDIDEKTYEAAKALSKNLVNVSVERIAVELIKLLTGSRPGIIKDVFQMRIMERFFPEMPIVGNETVNYLYAAKPEKEYRLAALFIGQSESVAKRVLKRLKLDNETIKIVSILVRHINDDVFKDPISIRRMLYKYGEDIVRKILDFMEIKAQSLGDLDTLSSISEAKNNLNIIIKNGDCTCLKDLAVNGKDLLQMGIEPGKSVGDALAMLMEEVIREPSLNNREQLVLILNKNR